MPVLVEQDADHAPGVARLRLASASGLDVNSVQIRVSANQGGADRHLDPSATGAQVWSPTEKWFTGASVSAAGAGLTIDLGPSATWHLKPYQPYAIAFRDATGTVVEDRMSWIGLRLPSDPPPPSAELDVAAAGYPDSPPAVEPVPDPIPDPVQQPEQLDDPLAAFADMAEEAEEVEPPKEPESARKTAKPVWMYFVGGVLLLALILAAVWFLVFQNEPEQTVAEEQTVPETATPEATNADPQPIPLTVEGARTYLKEQKPAADDILTEAHRFEDAGQHEAAFLLYKSAARKGSGPAALRMAEYYDPNTHSSDPGVVASPDSEIAANWYEDAARAGETPAMERLGEMLKTGMVSRPDAPEQGVFWLNKAAEAGSEKARELLK
jgi:hypothetical protein